MKQAVVLVKGFSSPLTPIEATFISSWLKVQVQPPSPSFQFPASPAPLRPQHSPSSYVAFCPATTERSTPSEREDKCIIVICELVIFILAFNPEFPFVSKCGKIVNFKGITMDSFFNCYSPIQNHICF